MPLVYQGVCSNCDFQTPVMRGGYSAVFVGQPPVKNQNGRAAAPDSIGMDHSAAPGGDARFVVLPHPLESAILSQAGCTKRDLFWQGRFVAVTNVICRQCGRVFPHRRLEAPGGAGCTAALVIGLAVGIAAGVARRSFIVGFVSWYVASFLAAVAAAFLAGWYVRRRFADRAAALAAERCCPACGADDSVDIYRAKKVRCPECRQAELSFKTVGKS